MILNLYVNYHREINPNTSCYAFSFLLLFFSWERTERTEWWRSSWTIGTLSCGTYILVIFTLAIAFNCLISSQKCICFNSHCLSVTFVILFDFVKLVLCYFYVGRCDDPTCVHFVFKCKIVNNALIFSF
jgi:hypothetical protein